MMRAKLVGVVLASALLVLGACSSASGSGSKDPEPSPFTGTWREDVSATESYEYVFAEDRSFEYTHTVNGTAVDHFKGNYSFQLPSSYTEHVTHQDNGGGFVALGAGAWTTTYLYGFFNGVLHFEDNSGYERNMTKQIPPI